MNRLFTPENQTLTYENWTDANGNPAGGVASATGLCISWQNGPLGRRDERKEPNGAFMETVIDALMARLHFYQTASDGKFACTENAEAINSLKQANAVLRKRTARRESRGVEGTHEA